MNRSFSRKIESDHLFRGTGADCEGYGSPAVTAAFGITGWIVVGGAVVFAMAEPAMLVTAMSVGTAGLLIGGLASIKSYRSMNAECDA